MHRPSTARALLLAALVSLAFCATSQAAPTITRFHKGLSGHPLNITAGPGHALWFTEFMPSGHGIVGRITHSGKVKQFRRGITGALYAGNAPIVQGPDGDVWFAESNKQESKGFVARMTPSG